MCEPGQGHDRGSFRAIFSNWREYDAPVTTKVAMALRNSWIRIRYQQACCGNNGQPGC